MRLAAILRSASLGPLARPVQLVAWRTSGELRRVDHLLPALAFAAFIALSIGRLPEVMPTPISAADDLRPLVYPFVGEEGPWRIASGDLGGEPAREGYQRFSLSFAAESGKSEGRTVVSPATGVVNWVDTGGTTWRQDARNCISIKVDGDDTHYVGVCHIWFDRVYNVGDRVTRGDRIGVVGPKDDHSLFPRIQATLYTADGPRQAGRASGRQPAPFAGHWSLSGCGYPEGGSGSPEYAGAVGLPDRCPSSMPRSSPSATSAPAATGTAQ